MQIITEGHKYSLKNFENNEVQTIQFIEKSPSLTSVYNEKTEKWHYPLYTVNDGTTNEEILEMLIDRMNYLNNKLSSRENSIVITHLETALLWLEKRTRDRIKRSVEGKHLV